MSTTILHSPCLEPTSGTKALSPNQPRETAISLNSLVLLVVWMLCASVSLFALLPAPRVIAKASVPVEIVPPVSLEVKLSNLSSAAAEQDSKQNPVAPRVSSIPLPAPIPVAEPSPAIAFAVPMEGPIEVVEPARAAHRSSADGSSAKSENFVAPQTLIFGQGEGVQPAPSYPPRAAKLRQEGVVGVRLTVDSRGTVIAASAIAPSNWPLLNQAAVRTIEQKWRFSPGSVRVFDVSIHFRLKQ